MPNSDLPYDQGTAAYKQRIDITKNPYTETDWQADEWDKGWNAEFDMDDSDSYDWATNTFKKS